MAVTHHVHLTDEQAGARCAHCAVDLKSVPGTGWLGPTGERIALRADGEADHVHVPLVEAMGRWSG